MTLKDKSPKKGADNLYQESIVFKQKMDNEETSLLERKKEVALAEISFNAKLKNIKETLKLLKFGKDSWLMNEILLPEV